MKGNIYKNGLELLSQRNKFPANLDLVLEKLPPISNTFFKYYNTGSLSTMLGVGEIVKVPDIGICSVVQNVWFEEKLINNSKYENCFDHLLSIEDILMEFVGLVNRLELWHQNGMIKLGMMAHCDIILLGVEEEIKDQIFVIREVIETGQIHFFSIDIFDFFSNLNQYLSDDDLKNYTQGKFSGNDLYKNWGDNLWKL